MFIFKILFYSFCCKQIILFNAKQLNSPLKEKKSSTGNIHPNRFQNEKRLLPKHAQDTDDPICIL